MTESNENQKNSDASRRDLSDLIANAALEKKAEDIRILGLAGLTDIADFFVICSGSSDLHVRAIVDNIKEKTKPVSRPWYVEGDAALNWVLLDYVDVVVHVFDRETRDYYQIERLWADAEVTQVQDPE